MKVLVDARAPATRLAAFRVVAAGFTFCYLVLRAPVFLALNDRPSDDFAGVGVISWLDQPLSPALFTATFAVTAVAALATTLGWRYRWSSIVFVVGLLVTITFRSSWGQLLHFEHLMVLQALVLAASPAADAWSRDARRGAPSAVERTDSARYGWPLAVAGLITIVTYVIAGVAKLRYGGAEWLSGDTLANHIAYSTTRLDLIGGNRPLLAEFAIDHRWLLGVSAYASVAIELAAPIVLLGGRARTAWVAAAWLMHLGILLTMSVGFPSPLFGVAFAPFFALERGPQFVRRWCALPAVSGNV